MANIPVRATARGGTGTSIIGTSIEESAWTVTCMVSKDSVHRGRTGPVDSVRGRFGGKTSRVDEPVSSLLSGRFVGSNNVGVDHHDGVELTRFKSGVGSGETARVGEDETAMEKCVVRTGLFDDQEKMKTYHPGRACRR